MASTSLQTDTTEKFVVDQENTEKNASKETDPHRLEQRLRQITYGKNTLGYASYTKAVPKDKRKRAKKGEENRHPVTPDIHQVCSKRAFDGQVRKWRRQLHFWDPKAEEDEIKIEVTQEYAPPEHEERHGARLGTPLRDDSLAEVDADPMEPPQVEKRSSSGVPGPSTGSKRDTASGSVTQPTDASQANATSKRHKTIPPRKTPQKGVSDTIFDDWEEVSCP
ncbi:g7926 [Coccomyxa elongata]